MPSLVVLVSKSLHLLFFFYTIQAVAGSPEMWEKPSVPTVFGLFPF